MSIESAIGIKLILHILSFDIVIWKAVAVNQNECEMNESECAFWSSWYSFFETMQSC